MSFVRVTNEFSSEKKLYIFKPQEDITAYEIAQISPILMAAWKDSNDIYGMLKNQRIPESLNPNVEELSEVCRRHFQTI